VTTHSGERFMLRLAVPGWRTLLDLQSEAMWLEALARDTPIAAPRIVRTRDGQLVLPMEISSVPKAWNVTLMTQVPGRLLGHYLNVTNLRKMGELFAQLHRHGGEWRRPRGFTSRRFVHWLSRDEPNILVGDGAIPPVSKRAGQLIDRMHRHVEDAYAAVDPSDLRVIHCDLWHDNIKLHHGRLHPFDFEDTVLGYRAHDIAMAMLDLLETTNDADYPLLLDAFRDGYETSLPWPTDRIEPFQAGRLLWKLNWIARHERKSFEQSFRAHLPVFERYETAGALRQLPR
jgi:Ser/Thr protein kinase RdoA (MazF antagonist)